MLAWDGNTREPRPGVLVAHTIRGRSEFEEGKAKLLAQNGYVGFAIDVYGKDAIGSDIESCREHMDALRKERATLQRRLLVALQTMRDQAEVDASRVAAIGYCFGGLCVLDIARTGEPLAGVVTHNLLNLMRIALQSGRDETVMGHPIDIIKTLGAYPGVAYSARVSLASGVLVKKAAKIVTRAFQIHLAGVRPPAPTEPCSPVWGGNDQSIVPGRRTFSQNILLRSDFS